MQDRNIVPEYEIFDLGQMTSLARLLNKPRPAGRAGTSTSTFVMNVPGGMPGHDRGPGRLQGRHEGSPGRLHVLGTGIGRSTVDVILASLSAGGHLRVGMEDTITYRKGVPVESNAQLVARAKAFARAGRPGRR